MPHASPPGMVLFALAKHLINAWPNPDPYASAIGPRPRKGRRQVVHPPGPPCPFSAACVGLHTSLGTL